MEAVKTCSNLQSDNSFSQQSTDGGQEEGVVDLGNIHFKLFDGDDVDGEKARFGCGLIGNSDFLSLISVDDGGKDARMVWGEPIVCL